MTAQSVIQTAFHSGEWAPSLNARVDLAKYHSAVSLGRNFFVDYRGGLSTRTGTKYILQCKSLGSRLIPFQASFTVNYELEFGDLYVRFIYNGAPVLEATKSITGATRANPGVITAIAHGYSVGDWVYITGVGGMTQLNGKYFRVKTVPSADTYTLGSVLNNTAINTTAYGTYTSGGTSARIYTLASPYTVADVSQLKYAQNVNTLTICHPDFTPYVLTLITAASWTLIPITFGATVAAPTGQSVTTTLAGGSVSYAYAITAVDANGQESPASAFATSSLKQDLRSVAGTNSVTWSSSTGAVSYNVYKTQVSYAGAVPAGTQLGFIGNCTGVTFIDSNISPDYSLTPPIARNPFQGAGVISATITAPGTYTSVPTVTIADAPSGGVTATASAILQAQTGVIGNGTSGWSVGDVVIFPNGVTLIVATVAGDVITSFQLFTYPGSNRGAILSGSTPANPVDSITVSPGTAIRCTGVFTWGVGIVQINSQGAGYLVAPGITFGSGAAAATAVLGVASSGNPTVPSFFQQRLALAGPSGNPQQFNMSQTGSYYNYNISNPVQDDDAIDGTLVSTQLNNIKAMLSMTSGLVVITDKQAWLVNGGAAGTPITPANATAQAQAYNGASDVPPIIANNDIIYVQAKGSYFRDLTFNFYTAVYTGTDISALSSHLFYGYTITGLAWAEEPFKTAWAVRDDGALLTLTFLKEQELVGWCHSDTNGLFKSVSTVTETTSVATVDALYTIVERTINGVTVQYIERFAERIFPNGMVDAWCVDAGLQYSGAPATSFTGGEHLAGATVTGLADGLPITSFVMPTTGNFTLTSAASKVTVGLAFTPQFKTLAIDTGEPTIQGKVKHIPAVDVRVADTLGLRIGPDFDHMTVMKDLVLGQVSSMLTGQQNGSQVVTDLVTGDARTYLPPAYTVPGQYCIDQPLPYPASILGVIPQLTVGDTK